METIAIQVDEAIAKAYRAADPAEQLKLQQLLNRWLRQTIQRRPLDTIIQDRQTPAQANGLTQAVLNNILDDA
ncbi:MAG: hypothetical protein EA342_05385 [Leptolyngbya sp. LCM1.Bin17]|nr:MAG: hypothetical protein EA342_05385 [Leptolyngbya sp. LCM1.Bin17]